MSNTAGIGGGGARSRGKGTITVSGTAQVSSGPVRANGVGGASKRAQYGRGEEGV